MTGQPTLSKNAAASASPSSACFRYFRKCSSLSNSSRRRFRAAARWALLSSAAAYVPINGADELGYTALHYAARRGSIGCVKALLAHGANRRTEAPKPKAAQSSGDIIGAMNALLANEKAKAAEVAPEEKNYWGTGTMYVTCYDATAGYIVALSLDLSLIHI